MTRALPLALLMSSMALAQTTTGVARAPANAVSLTDTGATRTYACENRSVIIAGSGSTFTLSGQCDFINVTGSHNTITVNEVRVLQVLGDDNHITWTKRPRYTFINARTSGNTVTPAP